MYLPYRIYLLTGGPVPIRLRPFTHVLVLTALARPSLKELKELKELKVTFLNSLRL